MRYNMKNEIIGKITQLNQTATGAAILEDIGRDIYKESASLINAKLDLIINILTGDEDEGSDTEMAEN